VTNYVVFPACDHEDSLFQQHATLPVQAADVFALDMNADNSLARPGKKQATATEDADFHISYL
jgi:hypothetical protein